MTGTITVGGSPVTVTTTTTGQLALLTFSATTGQKLHLKWNTNTFPGSTGIALRKPDGSLLFNTSIPQNDVGIDEFQIPGTGTYTIVIDPEGSSIGSLTLKLDNPPPDVTASITPNGAPVTVTTTLIGQNARLTFAGTAGQQISISVSNVTIPGSTYIYLLTSTGGQLARGNYYQGISNGAINAVTLPATGTYTILVDPYGAGVGSMTLLLTSP